MIETATDRFRASYGPRRDAARARVAAFGGELRRRGALVRQPQPAGIAAPALRLLLGELGTFLDTWRARRRAGDAPALVAAASRPVMLLPGFGSRPRRMRALRAGLEAAGHRVRDWGVGRNLGASPERLDELCERVVAAAREAGEPLALVGWSLGGLFAREVAKRHPEAVSLVVTLGSPFSGDLHANRAWRAYHWVTGQDVSAPPVVGDLAAKPPVPTVALWSPRDGIIHPRAACGRAGERDAAIALRCTHFGFASHPAVLDEILRQLDAPRG